MTQPNDFHTRQNSRKIDIVQANFRENRTELLLAKTMECFFKEDNRIKFRNISDN